MVGNWDLIIKEKKSGGFKTLNPNTEVADKNSYIDKVRVKIE